MKLVLILFISLCLFNEVSAETEHNDFAGENSNNQSKIIPGIDEYYFRKYIEFLDGDKIVVIIKEYVDKEKQDMSEQQKFFYTAGIIRGLREYVTFADYKDSRGLGAYHFIPEGENGAYEKIGWAAGCKFGKETGDTIFKDFLKSLGGEKKEKE